MKAYNFKNGNVVLMYNREDGERVFRVLRTDKDNKIIEEDFYLTYAEAKARALE